MKKLFGTDGIRGKANYFPIEPSSIVQVGKAIGKFFSSKNKKTSIVIGKDTRLSGYMIENALTAGLLSSGADVLLVGPLPTPAVSHLTKSLNCQAGVMISASHNPAEHNGIKIFDENGFKLCKANEKEIEKIFFSLDNHKNGIRIGKAFRVDDARGRYIEFAKSTIDNASLAGLRIVLDCANGAAYSIAPKVFSELGAEVFSINVSPNGLNINKNCGALNPKPLQKEVLKQKADFGISFDGDADRVLACDNKGNSVNGDALLAVFAKYFYEKKLFEKKAVALTQMSNLALHEFLEKMKIKTVIADVGDRNVCRAMREKNILLGGEQSGHIILKRFSETPDALVAALYLAKILKESEKSAEKVLGVLKPFPQVLVNVKVREKIPFNEMPEVKKAIEQAEKELGEKGRLLVRYSGTENLARVMAEGKNKTQVNAIACKIAEKIHCGVRQ